VSGFVNSVGFVISMSGFVDSMRVCRFHDYDCRFYEGLVDSMSGFVDSVGFVKSMCGFVDSIWVCRFHDYVCRFYEGFVDSMSVFVDSVNGFVDYMREFVNCMGSLCILGGGFVLRHTLCVSLFTQRLAQIRNYLEFLLVYIYYIHYVFLQI